MKKLNIGIIACSNVAIKRFVPALLESQCAHLYIVGSRDTEKAHKIANQFNCDKYGTYNDVLINADVDVVYISTPITLREELALSAIKNNKHVICEKPAFNSFETASKLVALCKKNNIRLLDGWSFKYHQQHEIVKKYIESGIIGDAIFFSGQFMYPHPEKGDIRLNPELGGGVFFDAAGYPVAAAQMFITNSPVSVFCTRNFDDKYLVDNLVLIQIQYEKNVNAIATAGFDLQYNSTYSITGRKGRISVKRAYAVEEKMETTINIETNDGIEKIAVPPQNQFLLMINEFCSQITSNRLLENNLDKDMLDHHFIMDAALKSSIEKKPVFL
jgi:predicted dehydrogenase|tara:strand:+ start:918 stop:1907 length:990 start_codon:yes stop_codon:yes gene_type:complete